MSVLPISVTSPGKNFLYPSHPPPCWFQKTLSFGYLAERGLRKGGQGGTINELGRVMSEVGFARAFHEALDDRNLSQLEAGLGA